MGKENTVSVLDRILIGSWALKPGVLRELAIFDIYTFGRGPIGKHVKYYLNLNSKVQHKPKTDDLLLVYRSLPSILSIL